MSIEINGKIYRELRCVKCRKLICLEYIHSGRVAFQCPRCGELNAIEFKSLEKQNITAIDWDTKFKIKSNDMRGGEK